MEDSTVKVKGGVVGAKRVLALITESDEIEEIRDCLKELFLYELANEMRGSSRYQQEYEKRIDRYSVKAEHTESKNKS
jgi:hypothetical protein